MFTYLQNLARLAMKDRFLFPRVAVYVLTGQCNLNCAYCEDFGHTRNLDAEASLPLQDAQRVLKILRQGTDRIIVMGGEPLLYPHIDELIAYARHELRFRKITLSTNGWLLPRAEGLLPDLDRLVVSLDSVDPQIWSGMIGMPVETALEIIENIRRHAALQKRDRYHLIVNAVLSPQSLPGAPALLDFCRQSRILLSVSPQMVNNWPRYELITSPEYPAFIRELLRVKRRGGPVAGSLLYLKMLLDLQPFSCYPTLTPRVLPNGDLTYPCRPIEKSGHAHGGRPCNLTDIDSWTDAQAASLARYDEPPQVCNSCFQQCYAEPSLMQAKPLSMLWEYLRYPVSRRIGIDHYAPG